MHSKSRITSYFQTIEEQLNKNETIIDLNMFHQVLELFYVGDNDNKIASMYGIGSS